MIDAPNYPEFRPWDNGFITRLDGRAIAVHFGATRNHADADARHRAFLTKEFPTDYLPAIQLFEYGVPGLKQTKVWTISPYPDWETRNEAFYRFRDHLPAELARIQVLDRL